MIEFTLDRMDIFLLFLFYVLFKFFEAFFKAFHDTRQERKEMERLIAESGKNLPNNGKS